MAEGSKDNLNVLKKSLWLLHHFRMVHLDIKPQNVVFSPASKGLKLIDFGFSRVVGEEKGQKTLSSFLGSVGYCSP